MSNYLKRKAGGIVAGYVKTYIKQQVDAFDESGGAEPLKKFVDKNEKDFQQGILNLEHLLRNPAVHLAVKSTVDTLGDNLLPLLYAILHILPLELLVGVIVKGWNRKGVVANFRVLKAILFTEHGGTVSVYVDQFNQLIHNNPTLVNRFFTGLTEALKQDKTIERAEKIILAFTDEVAGGFIAALIETLPDETVYKMATYALARVSTGFDREHYLRGKYYQTSWKQYLTKLETEAALDFPDVKPDAVTRKDMQVPRAARMALKSLAEPHRRLSISLRPGARTWSYAE